MKYYLHGVLGGLLLGRKGSGSESRSVKETVPVPFPELVARLALLLCVLCCFPSRSGPLVQGCLLQLAALPYSPAAAWVSALEAQVWFWA